MRLRITYQAIILCLTFLVTGCVENVSSDLPLDELPEAVLAAKSILYASPGDPISAVSETFPVATKVDVIGKDRDSAWLLVVAEKQTVGWVPAFYARTGVANLESAIVLNPLLKDCTTFLDSTAVLDTNWSGSSSGSLIVQGSIYLAETVEGIERG